MTTVGQDASSRTSTEFVDDTVLEAFVPSASQVNLQELLEGWDGDIPEDSNSIVPFIEQRQFLLLDEVVNVYIVLRTKVLGESTLEAYLSRLVITLEARAVGSLLPKPGENQSPAQPTQANELLFTETINNLEEPTICATEVQTDDDSEPVQSLYVFWKVQVPIGRPKAKIQKLGIYFAPSASLRPIEANKPETVKNEYMTTLVPQPINLLQPFANDPALDGQKPQLSALRISRARPTTPTTKQLLRSLKSGPRRLFRAAPSFLWRVRFTRLPSSTLPRAIIASVDLEVTPFAGSDVSFDKLQLKLSSGRVEAIGPPLPLRSRPGDQVTLLYKLIPHASENSSYTAGQHLTIDASSTVFISKTCKPDIKINWANPVDLPSSRPNSRSGPKITPKPLGPDSLPIIDQFAASDASTTVTNGVSFTISGPPEVQVGQMFKWNLFVINRSDKVHRLAVLAMPKRRLIDRRHGQRDSATSIITPVAEKDKNTVAEPVLDDHAIYTSQRNAVLEPTELICLSPDVRIGPLAPLACFETELKFIALASGVLYLDSLRVVDLNTQEATDIRDVPDIVARDAQNL